MADKAALEMKNNTYDFWKNVTQIALPGVGALYFAIAQIWGLPYGEEVVGTIAAVVTFLGVLLKVSSVQYNKHGAEVEYDGEFVVNHNDPMQESYEMQLEETLEGLEQKDELRIRVTHI